jgi:hypothetical protein
MILYHGSNMAIENIDLGKCKPFKDFGCGFYTTPIREQAITMAKRTVRIYREGKPCITEFYLDDAILETGSSSSESLNIKKFKEPCNEWARFVINNRNRKFNDIKDICCNTDNKYDIVIGPVANDDITALIDVYLSGIITDDALTRELTFRDLSMQISFHSKKAVKYLKKTGVFYG